MKFAARGDPPPLENNDAIRPLGGEDGVEKRVVNQNGDYGEGYSPSLQREQFTNPEVASDAESACSAALPVHPVTPPQPRSSGVVVDFGGWRVADTPLCWTVENLRGGKWRPRSYCRSREGLLRCVREHVGPVALDVIPSLPDFHIDWDSTKGGREP